MAWKNILKIIKSKIIQYSGEYQNTLINVFNNTKIGDSSIFGINKNIIYSIHGVSYDHTTNVNDNKISCVSKDMRRWPYLKYEYYYPNVYYLYKNKVKTPYQCPYRKGCVIIQKHKDNTATIKINDQTYFLTQRDANRPTVIWFDTKEPANISVDVANGNVWITQIAYYVEEEVDTSNTAIVLTDI